MENLRTADERCDGRPGYELAPCYLRVEDGEGDERYSAGAFLDGRIFPPAAPEFPAGDRIHRATKLLKPQR